VGLRSKKNRPPHYVEKTLGDTDLVFLEVFSDARKLTRDISLARWAGASSFAGLG